MSDSPPRGPGAGSDPSQAQAQASNPGDQTPGASQGPAAPPEGASEDTTKAKPSPLSQPWVRIALVAALIGLVLAGGVWFLRHQTFGRYQQKTEDAYVAADAVTVSPRISGTVDAVLVRENQWVQAGQPLVRMSSRDYDAQRARAVGQAQSAEAGVRGAEAAIVEQGATLIQARARAAAAMTELRHAQAEVDRYAPLAASGAESDLQYDRLRRDRDKAAAEVRAQTAGLLVEQRRLPGLTAQRDQARGDARAARAQVAAAQVDLDATVIRARTAGRIGDLTVRAGQTVQPGVGLMSVVPVQTLYVEARFKETQMGLIRPGQPAELEVDALPGAPLRGVVDSVAPATSAQFALIPPQNATGNFTKVVQRVPVRIRLDAGPEARQLLVPGLSVRVVIDTRSARDAADRIARETRAREH